MKIMLKDEGQEVNFVNWEIFKLLGELFNSNETKELNRWISLLTKTQPREVSDEFNEFINNAVNPSTK